MAEERKRELLVEELRQAVGDEAVERADLDIDGALERRRSMIGAAFQSARLMLLVIGAAFVVIGVIASLALENWVFFGLAIAAHALLSTVVIASALALSTEADKPDPTVEAALEDEGVTDPSGTFNDLVEQVNSQAGERS